MAENILIRSIEKKDTNSIVSLSHELGYQVNAETVDFLIESILNDEKQWAFVAEKNNEVIGFVHAFYALRLTTPPFIEIAGLIVSENERSNGLGKMLVNYIELNCAQNLKIRVRCNSNRKDAHRFYTNNGFSKQKEQLVFIK